MPVHAKIKALLSTHFEPEYLEVVNESHQHNVPEGAETHFKVVIASAAFVEHTQVARHRLVYAVLAELVQGPIHALALHTYTPEEWLDVSVSPNSPNCRGGS